ncbi:leucine-rich repeat neuronal protein 1-like [Cimex lectularius]|uniref:LRRCT domain-containing protein n=1 Tax=Cimex lectularius TaxID=79782 RepID=A0A8I6S839_CIMLE|nr:leucine-rich repeat neuronal protein 1-like [Cimex lectularius]
MLSFVIILVSLGEFALGQSRDELCTKCSCDGGTLNCSSRGLNNHFAEENWKGANFTVANFDRNSILHLTRFPPARIVKLVLSHNGMTIIDDAAFRFLKDLEELDLSHNHLTTEVLKPNVFQGVYSTEAYEPLMKLRKLLLNENALHSLHRDFFEHLPAIEELNLSGNPFMVIDNPTITAISSISYLKYLDMSSTMLSDIPATMMHTPKYLQTLNISYNNFFHVPTALGEAHVLSTLIMDVNPIKEINKVPFIPSLKVLHINYMPLLTRIDKGGLSNFTHLEELSCSFNKHLKFIDENAFTVSTGATKIWPPMRKIYLNNNNLQYLEQYLILHTEKIKSWSLHTNPWVCDCQNQWMVNSLLPQINKTNPNEATRLFCSSPSEMVGMRFLDLHSSKTNMRCLDAYGNHPEKDSLVLVVIILMVMISIPLMVFSITSYLQKTRRNIQFSRFLYRRTESLESLP